MPPTQIVILPRPPPLPSSISVTATQPPSTNNLENLVMAAAPDPPEDRPHVETFKTEEGNGGEAASGASNREEATPSENDIGEAERLKKV